MALTELHFDTRCCSAHVQARVEWAVRNVFFLMSVWGLRIEDGRLLVGWLVGWLVDL